MPGRWPAPCATASRCLRRSPAWIRRGNEAPSAGTPSPRGSRISTRTSPTGSSARSRRFPASASSRLPRRPAWTCSTSSSTSCSRRCSRTTAASSTAVTTYRFSNRARLEHAEQRAMTAEEYVASQNGRAEDTAAWLDWFAEHRIDAVVEPTIPIVAPLRGTRLRGAVRRSRRSFTHALLGLDGVPGGRRSPRASAAEAACPTSVSLIGRPGADWDLLSWGAALQDELGTVSP